MNCNKCLYCVKIDPEATAVDQNKYKFHCFRYPPKFAQERPTIDDPEKEFCGEFKHIGKLEFKWRRRKNNNHDLQDHEHGGKYCIVCGIGFPITMTADKAGQCTGPCASPLNINALTEHK